MRRPQVLLAHLNPITDSHVRIIDDLIEYSGEVYVLPVIFKKDGKEVTTKFSPFTYEERHKMLTYIFGKKIKIASSYTFESPFIKYLPPILSPYSFKLRMSIERSLPPKSEPYTGDVAEAFLLKLYFGRTHLGHRKPIPARNVRKLMYADALGHKTNWRDFVPGEVTKIIEESWERIKFFAEREEKDTVKILGFKFPVEGLF